MRVMTALDDDIGTKGECEKDRGGDVSGGRGEAGGEGTDVKDGEYEKVNVTTSPTRGRGLNVGCAEAVNISFELTLCTYMRMETIMEQVSTIVEHIDHHCFL